MRKTSFGKNMNEIFCYKIYVNGVKCGKKLIDSDFHDDIKPVRGLFDNTYLFIMFPSIVINNYRK